MDTPGKYNTLPSPEVIQATAQKLIANGINTLVVSTGAEAKAKALELLPPRSEVMNMTSVTLTTLDLDQEIMESGRYTAVKKQLMSMNRATQGRAIRQLGSAPEYAIGSVHAVTVNGEVLIASASGSQLPAYIYGADKVIWIVGAQKIVADIDAGIKRIYEYCLPIESQRVKKAYNLPGSSVNKLVIINREPQPHRTTLILVNEILGV